jgi:hypothetical protein
MRDMPTSLRRTEEIYPRYVLQPGPGVTPEQLQSTGFWVHVQQRLCRGDVIEVRPQDGSFYMELWLIGKNAAKLTWRVTHFVSFAAEAQSSGEANDNLVVEWGGKVLQYRILDRSRPSDQHEIVNGFATEDEAKAALELLRRG